MFGPNIPISKELMEKLNTAAQKLGYSSGQEFAVHILERECATYDEGYSDEDRQQVEDRLRGLGYM